MSEANLMETNNLTVNPIMLKSGDFRINDIKFIIPPESITIQKIDYDMSAFILRKSAPSTNKTGRKRVLIHVPMAIDLSDPLMGYTQVAKLLMQVRKTPLVTIENEKVRLEILGPNSDKTINMGAIVESITGAVDNEFPSILRCDITMSWFNYLPYTSGLHYRGDPSKGERAASNTPTAMYKTFYTHDTTTSGFLINDPSGPNILDNSVIDIFYKEYVDITNSVIDVTETESLIQKRKYKRVGSESIKKEGWVPAAKSNGMESIDSTYYRWRKISIPTHILMSQSSGALILEDMGFSLQTNVAYIPLQGYSIPIPQFMGGSISTLRLIIFAGAEANTALTPIGTSIELARLQKVLDTVSENRVRFAKHSKDDYILIKHPLAKLLKYEKRIETATTRDSFYWDEEKGKVVDFSYADMMPMVSSSVVSKTVEGAPFCSRVQIDLKETRFIDAKRSVTMATDDGGKTSRYIFNEAWIQMLQILINRYKIECNDGSYSITSDLVEEDKIVASKLVQALNNMLLVEPKLTSLSFIRNSDYYHQTNEELITAIKRKAIMRKNPSEIRPVVGLAGYSGMNVVIPRITGGFVNKEGVAALVADIVQIANRNEKSLGNVYKDTTEKTINYNRVPQSDVYPDIKIPKSFPNPAHYFYETENIEEHRDKSIKGSLRQQKEIETKLMNSIFGESASAQVGPLIRPADRTFNPAINVSGAMKDKNGLAAAHQPNDGNYRGAMLTKALMDATVMHASLKYAYPGIKIYLQTDNFWEEKKLSGADLSSKDKKDVINGFSDFSEYFDLDNIVDVRIVNDEEDPAHMAVIRLAIPHREMVDKIANGPTDPLVKERSIANAIVTERRSPTGGQTEYEELFARIGLREGTRIQIRLGYETDPNKLDREFNGKIASVSGTDILEIVCLGDGGELIQDMKGVNGSEKEYTFNSNTPDIAKKIFEDAPEVRSFGNTGYKSSFWNIEMQWLPWFAGGKSILDNIFAPSLTAKDGEILNATLNAASIMGTIGALFGGFVGAAIGAGIGAAGGALWGIFKSVDAWISGSPFTVYNQTIWDVFQELTLRHPGTICSVVPFDNRSTIFFGEPNEYYFYRGPNPIESTYIREDTFWNNTMRETLDDEVLNFADTDGIRLEREGWNVYLRGQGSILNGFGMFNSISSQVGDERQSKMNKLKSDIANQKGKTRESTLLDLMKPFRTYHLLTTEHDIIANNIEVTSRDVANSVQISYPSDSDDGNFDGSKGFSDYKLTDEMKADDDLRKDKINNKVFTFGNAHKELVDDLPERYAQALLCKELEKVYRGKILVTGRPKIKPHDVCIIRDTYNDINGPVGVSRVVHIISPRDGWVTEITPKMMVFPSNASGYYQLSMIHRAATFWLGKQVAQFYTNRRPFLAATDGDRVSDLHNMKQEFGQVFDDEYFDLNKLTVTELSRKTSTGFLQTSGEDEIDDAIIQSSISMIRPLATIAFGVYGIALSFIASSVFDGFVNWSKYRQPIMFYPVARYGQPWYAALDGFKNNTRLESIEASIDEGIDRTKFYLNVSKSFLKHYLGD